MDSRHATVTGPSGISGPATSGSAQWAHTDHEEAVTGVDAKVSLVMNTDPADGVSMMSFAAYPGVQTTYPSTSQGVGLTRVATFKPLQTPSMMAEMSKLAPYQRGGVETVGGEKCFALLPSQELESTDVLASQKDYLFLWYDESESAVLSAYTHPIRACSITRDANGYPMILTTTSTNADGEQTSFTSPLTPAVRPVTAMWYSVLDFADDNAVQTIGGGEGKLIGHLTLDYSTGENLHTETVMGLEVFSGTNIKATWYTDKPLAQ